MTHTTPYARYVGRVGVLAFLLGAGVAVAHSPGVAAADTGTTERNAVSQKQPTSRTQPGVGPGRTRPALPKRIDDARAVAPASTFFAPRPTLAYNAAQNTQSAAGLITGTLNPAQQNDYALAYAVDHAPARGSVEVAANGGFSYTPGPEMTMLGGTDTFTVTADDRPGNPWHLHGLQTLFAPNAGHTASAPVTVLSNPGAPLPTSVLSTTDQLNAERLATELAASPLVQLAGLVLKGGWLLAARQNFALVGGPDQTNLARLDRAVTEYANQAALEVQLLDSMNPKVLQQVAPPHDWYLQPFAGSRIWYDNPDTIYRFIGVNSASSYVLTGRFDGSLPADTNFSVLTGLSGTTAANLNGRDLVLNPDGSFTITASSAPAEPGPTNHLQLVPGTTLITTRNTLTDWNSQEPMSLSVLRVSGPPPSLFSQIGGFAIPGIGPLVAGNPLLTSLVSLIPPLPAPRLLQEIETAAIMLLLGISGENQYMAVATTDSTTGQLRAPNTLSQPDRNASFLSTQLQSAGYFQLDDDEALVVTIEPGNARYFSVPVTDVWTITGNYWDEQTSLNVGQAVANPDGTYTFVVAKSDPAVANWVSTGGLNLGTISIRFQDLDRTSESFPTVGTQVVPLAQLGTVLPEGTVYVTEQQRAEQIAQRQLGYARRWAPYPQA